MAALHAAVALRAPTDRDVTRADEVALDGQFFLILRRDPHAAHRAVTLPTLGRQRRVVDLVDGRRLPGSIRRLCKV